MSLVEYDIKFIDFLKYNYDNELIIQSMNKYFYLAPFDECFTRDRRVEKIKFGYYSKILYDGNPIISLTNYTPFFPTMFFSTYFLLEDISLNMCDTIAFFGDTNLGMLEGCIKWCEDNIKYENNIYKRVPLYSDFVDINKVYNYVNTKTFSEIDYDGLNGYKLIFANVPSEDINKVLLSALKGAVVIFSLDILDGYIVDYLEYFFEHIDIISFKVSHPLSRKVFVVARNWTGHSNNLKIMKNTNSSSRINRNLRPLIDKWQDAINDARRLLISRSEKFFSFKQFLESMETSLQFSKSILVDKFTIKTIYKPLEFKINQDYTEFTFSKNKKLDFSYNYFEPCSTLKKLHSLKRHLNKHKRCIDTMEQFIDNDLRKNIVDWNKLTDCINIYRGLKTMVMMKFKAEYVTNAWMKIYEIIERECILKDIDEVKAFHVCEAPGAFILALNHYCKTHGKKYIWNAQSLNSRTNINRSLKDTNILGDEFGLIKRYKNRWHFSKNGSGDVTRASTVQDYHNTSHIKSCFATGDAGIKVPSNMFNEQERCVLKITYGQMLSMLAVLEKGGSCIFKAFNPLVENFTIGIIHFLTSYFDTVKIVKPRTSRPSSSEIYYVCKNFEGIDDVIFDQLVNVLDNFNPDWSFQDFSKMSKKFKKEIIECCKLYSNFQIESIKRSMYYRFNYYDNYVNQKLVSEERESRIYDWLESCGIKKIEDEFKIVKKFKRR